MIFSLMFHFSQRERAGNMKLTQNKAQKSVLLDKMGFDLPPHTHTKKGTLKRWKKIHKEEDLNLAVAIFFPQGQNYCFP